MIDEDLVRQAKHGDKDALLKLILSRKDEYYRLAVIHTGNQEDAMDAVQDMTVIIYRQIQQLKKTEAFYSWSLTILINCCRKIVRQRHRFLWLDDEVLIAPDLPAEQYIDLLQALSKLRPKQQEAVKLKYLIGMDYEAMARVLKIPVGTAKSRVFHGLSQLKIMLTKGGNNDG